LRFYAPPKSAFTILPPLTQEGFLYNKDAFELTAAREQLSISRTPGFRQESPSQINADHPQNAQSSRKSNRHALAKYPDVSGNLGQFSMNRRQALEALKAHNFGSRFILNFAYCEENNLFPPFIDRRLILDTITSRLAAVTPAAQIIALINDVLRALYHDRISYDKKPAFQSFDTFYRVIPFSTFMARTFPLLSSEATAEFGYIYSDRSDPSQLRRFAIDAVRPEWISTTATIRGRHPFAWTTTSNIFEPLIATLFGQEDAVGQSLCQLLAIEGFKEHEPLFLLRYPVNIHRGLSVRRPTALDGFGNLYFKARTDRDRDPTPPSSGFTLDISAVRNLDRALGVLMSCDGLPEYVATPTPFSSQFGLHWVGYFSASWLYCDHATVDAVLAGVYDVDTALDSAVDLLDSV
jgi:hypothetical protein